jgi:hypothetical protein
MKRSVSIAAFVGFLVLWAFAAEVQAMSPKPRALLLYENATPTGRVANYGEGKPVASTAIRALQEPFAGLGISFVATPAGAGATGLPSSADALQLAAKSGAALVVMVNVQTRSDGPIRATPMQGFVSDLRIRVFSSSKTIVDLQARGPGYHREPGQAVQHAVRAAIAKANLQLVPKLAAHWSPKQGTTLEVSISGATSWRSIASLLQKLATTRGVTSVHPVTLTSQEVKLKVGSTTGSGGMVASLRRTRVPNASLAVQARGNTILVQLTSMVPSEVPNG